MVELVKKVKKVGMPYQLRLFLLSIVSVVFLALLAALLVNSMGPRTEEQEITNYQYHQKGEITYEVALNDNLLYGNKVLGMNNVYPSKYVKQVTADLKYDFNGNKRGTVSGQYMVVATVQGIQMENQAEKVLWSKDFVLEPATPFSDEVTETSRVIMQKKLVIPFQDFNAFALQVQQDTGILSSVALKVKCLIKTEAETEYGMIQEELTPGFRLPLCMTYFEITGDLTQEKEGALTETVMQNIPPNRTLLRVLGGGAALCLLLLLGLLFFVRGTKPDAYQKRIKEIFKKYEERLVALGQALPGEAAVGKKGTVETEKYIRVKTVDDLVRIADEISRPVYYLERGLAGEKGFTFYVISDTIIFTYDLGMGDTNGEYGIRDNYGD